MRSNQSDVVLRLGLGGALMFACAASRAADEVRVIEQEQRYVLGATNRSNLVKELRERGPADDSGAHAAAQTRQLLEMRLAFDTTPRCRLREPEVTLTVTTILPEWKPRGRAARGLLRRWKATAAALEVHERGHHDLAVAIADELLQALRGLSETDRCGDLQHAADRLLLRATNRLQARHRLYDLRTQNGIAQGAVL